MDNFEKLIYNNFLEVSKRINNKPLRYRKNFDNFSDENYVYINKLSIFFKKFNHINIKDFFEAPYFVYNDNYYDLKFYLSHRAIQSYTLYNSNLTKVNYLRTKYYTSSKAKLLINNFKKIVEKVEA